MTLFNPIDPRRQVVTCVQKPTKPVQRYTDAESKALENHYIACMEVLRSTGAFKKSQANQQSGGQNTGIVDKVIEHIHGRWMGRGEIAEDLGLKEYQVSGALSSLAKSGCTKQKGKGRNIKHYGLQRMTAKRAKQKQIDEIYELIMTRVTRPMMIADISRATGIEPKKVRNYAMSLVDAGRLKRIGASDMGLKPSVNYLYAPAEGGEV